MFATHSAQPLFTHAPLPIAPRTVPVAFHPAHHVSQHAMPVPQVVHPIPAHAHTLPAHSSPAHHSQRSPGTHSVHTPLTASPVSAHHLVAPMKVPSPRVPPPLPVPRQVTHATSLPALHASSRHPAAKPHSAVPSPLVAPPLQLAPAAPAPPPATTSRIPSVVKENSVPLTLPVLTQVLTHLSTLLHARFGHQVRLFVHGGAVMVLHPHLRRRAHTRDVDYVHRAFEAQYTGMFSGKAGEMLRGAIAETATACGLGADWMNAGPDVALPLAATSQAMTYDPIATASLAPTPLHASREVFVAPGLALVAVDWAWALALKFVRYAKHDPDDVCGVLRMLYWREGRMFTAHELEGWIKRDCWAMGYDRYPPPRRAELAGRIQDALTRAYGDPELKKHMFEHEREREKAARAGRARSKSRSRTLESNNLLF